MDFPYMVVLVSVPSMEIGEKISQSILQKKLAACVSIIPGVNSAYRWQGEIETDSEFLLFIKSRASLLDLIITEVSNHHPYDVPEIIALPILSGSQAYLNWIEESTV